MSYACIKMPSALLSTFLLIFVNFSTSYVKPQSSVHIHTYTLVCGLYADCLHLSHIIRPKHELDKPCIPSKIDNFQLEKIAHTVQGPSS